MTFWGERKKDKDTIKWWKTDQVAIKTVRFCNTFPDIFESATFSFRIRLPSTRIRRIQIFFNPLSRVENNKSARNPLTCGRGNFWSRKEKVVDSKISGYVCGRPRPHSDTNSFSNENGTVLLRFKKICLHTYRFLIVFALPHYRSREKPHGSVCPAFWILMVELSGARSCLFWWSHRFHVASFFVHRQVGWSLKWRFSSDIKWEQRKNSYWVIENDDVHTLTSTSSQQWCHILFIVWWACFKFFLLMPLSSMVWTR